MRSSFCRFSFGWSVATIATLGLTFSLHSVAESATADRPSTLLPETASTHDPVPRATHLPETARANVSQSTLASERSLKPVPDFGSPTLEQQIERYWHYVAVNGPPDIAIVGSSRSLQGVDPAAMEQALAAVGRPDLRVYNFSVNGATARVVYWVLAELLDPDRLPEVIVFAAGSRAFNSGRDDRTFASIATSPGYRSLQRGMDLDLGLPVAQAGDRLDLATTALSKASAAFAAGCRIANYSPQGGWLLDRVRRQLTARVPCSTVVELPLVPRVPMTAPSGSIRPDGFLEDRRRFSPTSYYRSYPYVAGRYDGSYQPFRLNGIQDRAFRSLLTFAQQRQIPLVFVNLPLSEDYLDPTRRRYEAQFQDYLRGVARQYAMPLRDYLRLWSDRNDYFADPSHINRYGAAAIARQLAEDSQLPWP